MGRRDGHSRSKSVAFCILVECVVKYCFFPSCYLASQEASANQTFAVVQLLSIFEFEDGSQQHLYSMEQWLINGFGKWIWIKSLGTGPAQSSRIDPYWQYLAQSNCWRKRKALVFWNSFLYCNIRYNLSFSLWHPVLKEIMWSSISRNGLDHFFWKTFPRICILVSLHYFPLRQTDHRDAGRLLGSGMCQPPTFTCRGRTWDHLERKAGVMIWKRS